MAVCFVNAHSIMDTPHFSGDAVHGARNRNVFKFSAHLTKCLYKSKCNELFTFTLKSPPQKKNGGALFLLQEKAKLLNK